MQQTRGVLPMLDQTWTRARRGLLLAFVPLVALAVQACGDDANVPPPPDFKDAAPTELVRPDSPVIGPADARVTMVEFLDPECESCRAAFADVKAILDDYPKDLRLVVRYFPLHGNSVLAAAATEAAGEQGKYEEMQELLFARQPEWGEQQTPQTEKFVEYADELGLDVPRFRASLDKQEYRDKVARDKADGIAVGVTGTPTFFVDGKWISRPSPAALRAAIDGALKR